MTLHYKQASAGSGKTTSVEMDVTEKLLHESLLPSQIMAVTFTKDAAKELKERISQSLIKQGQTELAIGTMSARIGTVHSVFGQLLTDFAFELGLSPEQRVMDDIDKYRLLSEAVDNSLSLKTIKKLNELSFRLAIDDWQKNMLDIVELCRSNNISSEELVSCGQQSADSLLNQLPNASPTVIEASLRHALQSAVNDASKLEEPTKGLTKAIAESEAILRQPKLQWKNWLKVSKLDPTKMGEPAFSSAISMGGLVLECQQFRDELSEFIAETVNSAATVMSEFAQMKRERGLVDFIDQEQLALTALENPVIQSRLKCEIKYLIVDEFQDTNPIQLALFSKLSTLVEDVLMVGDAKQAIYGFRGSDPKLALNVLKHVENGAGITSSLPNSWRSRKGLVELVNNLFTQPFSHLLKPEQVQLAAKRTDNLSSADVEWWALEYDGRQSNPKIMDSLAKGIKEHIESKVEILDRDTQIKRIAVWKDLAVLCRSNKEVASLAQKCVEFGIPVSYERSGLLETPEATLTLACLRKLIDPNDSLASAEILALATGHGPESWLKDRLDAVENDRINSWNDSAHPVLSNLEKTRKDIELLSTKEVLDLALISGNVSETLLSWHETTKLTEHRLENLAKLRSMVDDYESHCKTQYLAASPTGFILWLKSLEQGDIDTQAANPGNAITITTYHRSKGLEWPIVICSSLQSPTKASLFGTNIIESNKAFDWENPLIGRSIRFWPNPFSESRGSDMLTNLLQESSEWKQAVQQAHNEAIQLLYVGMTRARDQLILPTIGSTDSVGNWLKLLDSNLFPFQDGQVQLPCGGTINAKSKTYLAKESDNNIDLPKRTRHWLKHGTATFEQGQKYFAPASSEAATENAQATVVQDFGSRININGAVDMDKLGSVLHHCFALILIKPETEKATIQNIIDNSVPGKITVEQVYKSSFALLYWIETNYQKAKVYTELPFSLNLDNGSLRQGEIDLAIETNNGWVIIDHKSNPQPSNKWLDIAMEHSGQLKAYKDAVEELSDKPVIKTLIHFSVSGGLVELVF